MVLPVLALAPGERITVAPAPARPVPSPSRLGGALAIAEAVSASAIPPAVWLAVGLLLLAREAAGHAILARRRRSWAPAPEALRRELAWPPGVPLLVAEEGPSTLGLLRPVVVLPLEWWTTLPREVAVCVARHELAHARWRDPLVHSLTRAVRALLWPGLPLWWLERILRAEREAAADAEAVTSRNERQLVVDYAASILGAATRPRLRQHRVRWAAIPFGSFGHGARLEQRIRRLFAAPRVAGPRLAAAAAVLAAGALAAVTIPVAPVLRRRPG